jgi:uncharacterized protein Veg
MKEKLLKIKKLIQNNVGICCCVTAKSGRKTTRYENCIIQSAYPEIFVVKHEDKNKKLSTIVFSYTDILIKKVSISRPKSSTNELGA